MDRPSEVPRTASARALAASQKYCSLCSSRAIRLIDVISRYVPAWRRVVHALNARRAERGAFLLQLRNLPLLPLERLSQPRVLALFGRLRPFSTAHPHGGGASVCGSRTLDRNLAAHSPRSAEPRDTRLFRPLFPAGVADWRPAWLSTQTWKLSQLLTRAADVPRGHDIGSPARRHCVARRSPSHARAAAARREAAP